MKYLEQRVEELEKEVTLLKAKNKLEETKCRGVKCPSNPIKVKSLSSVSGDNLLHNLDYVDSFDHPEYYPPYPNIISSWEDKPWGIDSGFDKLDNDFLKYLNFTEKKIEKEFGKIISKFKILTHEWEMDGYGYIVNGKTDNMVVITNHGKPMVANTDYLHSKIKDYKEIIQETERALFLIK